jgi:hypothetical protein
MNWREQNQSVNDRFQVSPRNPDGTRRRTGPHIGSIRVTPTRVTLVIALLGSVAFLAYALTVRESTQIPMLSAGAGVLGIVFCALALAGAISAYHSAQDGANGRAFGFAMLGGLAGLIAFGCFSGAVILALVWKP